MKASSQLESLLGTPLPNSYKDFIDKTGYLCLSNISMEVYGYRLDFDVNKIPCVVAATKLNKDDYNLEEHHIVISHTGIEDYIVVLDTISDCVFEMNLSGEKRFLAKSFSDWLSSVIYKNELSI